LSDDLIIDLECPLSPEEQKSLNEEKNPEWFVWKCCGEPAEDEGTIPIEGWVDTFKPLLSLQMTKDICLLRDYRFNTSPKYWTQTSKSPKTIIQV
jgi:hypothetical protein